MSRKDDPEKMAQMDRWLKAVCEELGLDNSVMAEYQMHMLDLIGQIAHGPSRPGAPLTAYLIGVAATAQNADAHELIDRVSALADKFE
ncbi:MAG: molybdopterin-guanine dinucleotide biosynthesis protein [Actinomycetaceae bacterium]|nr:molybdopterin-guanine dinucleotide biosynthesis protein [Actinomycetaceae bacterium]